MSSLAPSPTPFPRIASPFGDGDCRGTTRRPVLMDRLQGGEITSGLMRKERASHWSGVTTVADTERRMATRDGGQRGSDLKH